MLPRPAAKNGKRIACVGAGPASLTVARDLVVQGYSVTVFEGDAKAGGFMRTQVPRFRLPEEVIDEEVGYIIGLGVDFRGGQRIDSMKALLAQNFDAATPARWLARTIACATQDAGKDIAFPIHHVGVVETPLGDQTDVFGYGGMGRAGPLAIDDLVKVRRVRHVRGVHAEMSPPGTVGGATRGGAPRTACEIATRAVYARCVKPT